MSHPAQVAQASVAVLQSRALAARVMLWSQVALFAVQIALRSAALATASTAPFPVLTAIALVRQLAWYASAIFFLLWIHRLVRVTRQLDAPLSWSPGQAVAGFFIPFVNFVRPYAVLRYTQRALVENEVPEPPPEPVRSAEVGYREMRFVAAPAGAPVSNSFLGWWWGLYIAMAIVALFINDHGDLRQLQALTLYNLGANVLSLVTALFAIRVVGSLTGRVAERFRRLRYTSEEGLRALHVRISA